MGQMLSFAFCVFLLTFSEGIKNVKQNALKGDVKEVVWLNPEQVHLRTDRGFAYYSSDAGYTLAEFSCGGQGCVEALSKSPTEQMVLYQGVDKSWLVFQNGSVAAKIPLALKQVRFHPTKPGWLLGSTCGTDIGNLGTIHCDLILVRDFGKAQTVVTNILSHFMTPMFSWGSAKAPEFDGMAFFYLKQSSGEAPQPMLFRHDILRATSVALLPEVIAFGQSEGFLLAAQVSSSGVGSILVTSANNGRSWHEAHLPTKDPQFRYTVLDVSEHMLFLNVFHREFVTWGTTYLSDRSGQWFSTSLAYTRRNSAGLCDFHRVKGLSGVYIANTIPDFESSTGCQTCSYGDCEQKCSYKTRISYDKGHTWQPVPVPREDTVCFGRSSAKCSLHLHGFSSLGPAHDSIKSHTRSPGVILAAGNTGRRLNLEDDGEVDLFLSRDGGESFQRILPGKWIYGFSDHGGLIVVAPTTPTSWIKYTLDEGNTWNTMEFTSGPDDKVLVKQLVYNQDAPSARSILLETVGLDEDGRMYFVDFSDMSAECEGLANPGERGSDYEWWSPHGYNTKCYLGRTVKFVRKRLGAHKACWDPEESVRPVVEANCSCTLDDFECDYGFTTVIQDDGQPKCVQDKQFTLINDTCSGGFRRITQGYIKAVDDTCSGGLEYLDVRTEVCSASRGVLVAVLMLIVVPVLVGFLGLYLHANVPCFEQAVDELLTTARRFLRGGYRPLRPTVRFQDDHLMGRGHDGDDEEDEDDENPGEGSDGLHSFTAPGLQALPSGDESPPPPPPPDSKTAVKGKR
eukprot:RCo006780